MIVMLASVPFGYIGGWLSNMSRVLPFVLIVVLMLLGVAATLIFYRKGAESA
jgi:hypothetical protein